MSLEAWGDDDDGRDGYREQLIDAGWWTSEDVDEAREMVRALCSEDLYESCEMARGINPRFLMRLTLLRHKFGFPMSEELVAEAKAAFALPESTRGAGR